MTRKAIYLVLALSLLLTLISGCASSASPTPTAAKPAAAATAAPAGAATKASAPAGKRYQLALIVKNLVNPVWISMKTEAERAAKELGVDVVTMAPTKPDNVEEQLRMVEDLIQKKVDAIILVPADSKAIVPGIEKANAAGIPVINVNTKAYGGKTVTFVSSDNVAAGKMSAEFAIKAIGGKGKAIILEGVPAAQTAEDVKKGFMEALAANPGVTLLASQTANFLRAQGQSVTENLLQRYPDVDLILSANDEMAMGALQAIDAAGKSGKIKVASIDATKDGIKAVADGRMLVTVDKALGLQGYEGVKAAVRYLKGEKVDDVIFLQLQLIDQAKAKTMQ